MTAPSQDAVVQALQRVLLTATALGLIVGPAGLPSERGLLRRALRTTATARSRNIRGSVESDNPNVEVVRIVA